MMVVMTSWAPVVAFRMPGMNPQMPPARNAATIAIVMWSGPGTSEVGGTDQGGREPTDDELALDPDVEHARRGLRPQMQVHRAASGAL